MSQIDPTQITPAEIATAVLEKAALYVRDRENGEQILLLKKALLPFAKLLQDHNNFDEKGRANPNDKPIFGINAQTITLGDLRRAYAAVVS